MQKKLLKTVKAQVLNIRRGDILVFTIGDVEHNLIPTEKELLNFRKKINKFIELPKDITVAVFPSYIKISIVRKKKKK